jgi:hypothetical protein
LKLRSFVVVVVVQFVVAVINLNSLRVDVGKDDNTAVDVDDVGKDDNTAVDGDIDYDDNTDGLFVLSSLLSSTLNGR